ncbi:MAG: HAMP domain-containing histidine kinase [Candidatus Eremiobacteraeota bacterium]|nr:HAMP domain-containing histidine kinase [Candidatus Eremiobacteraeota bacterium]MCW5872520.1 HAMP domain-containing histidine kinase [Candidatus Eremiobacteraeota bacterium]
MVEEEVEFEIESRQTARERIFHMFTVPRLRVLGLSLLVLLAGINLLWLDPQPLTRILPLALALFTYGFGSWWVLRRWFAVLQGKWDLGLCFLIVDVPVWSGVVYVCGAERCWFSYVLLARVADQVATRFGRVLFFAHWIPLNYLAMVLCAQHFGHQVEWRGELCKALVMYIFGLYASLTARTAARLRRRTTMAVRAARQALKDLTAAREAAEAASRVKGQFLTMMDHELKTPLNGILGFSELLIQSPTQNLSEKQVRYLNNIHASGLRLGNLVSGILDLAQLKSGDLKLQLKAIDASRPLMLALHAVGDNLKSRSLTVDSNLGELPLCQGDPSRLQQVFFQLLDNAVKFSPVEGQIQLRAEHDESRLRISIRDSGPGIPLEHQQRIFEEWGKVDFTYRRLQEGAGIGLALAHQLMVLHGGRLSVESAPNQGACFSVELPIS